MDQLSFNTRKSLCNHLGEMAGRELAEYLVELHARLDRLQRTKVDRTPVVPDGPWLGLPSTQTEGWHDKC